jgi:uncharacterized membrane protein
VTGAGIDRATDPDEVRLEQSIARLLTIGTYASIALLAIGFALMLTSGIDPLQGGPRFDVTAIPGDLVARRPTGFLWLGLLAVIATPAARVLAALIGFARRGEKRMVVVAALILLVIALSVVVAQGLEG